MNYKRFSFALSAICLVSSLILSTSITFAEVYELRTYKAAEGKLEALNARFRDHTIELFNKHGIRSVAYWHPINEPDSADTLIYVIEHESEEAAKKSWKSFGSDPEWKKASKASGVGPLAKRPDSTYMKATDYSPMK